MAADYFRMLDINGDNLVSFSEFLSPILENIPPRVAIAFVSDMRFKIEVLNQIREAFRICNEVSEVVTLELVKGKLDERRDPLGAHHLK